MKHRFKKVIALVLCLSLLFIGIGNFTKSKAASPTYTDSGKKYTTRQILSDYQYFTKKRFECGNHFVGALACGGDAYFGSFGNGAIVPSYIKNVEKSGNYSGQHNSHYLAGYPKYKNLLNQPAYYKTISRPNSSLTEYPDKKGEYIDFKAAFKNLETESKTMASKCDKKLSDKNLKSACIDGQHGTLLTIPFSDTVKSVYIPFEIIYNTDWIMIDGVKDLDELVSTEHIISIGVSDLISIGGDYSYVAAKDNKIAVFISTNKNDGKDISFKNSQLTKKAYLLEDGHGLKTLNKAETIQSGQMDLSGMKLIWNFPYNSSLTCKYLPGHVLAPNACVTINGGNFEGGYIANRIINCQAEGHFYPYGEVTEPASTPEPSVAPTAVPTKVPTATPSQTVAPTEVPTATPSQTVAPTEVPTATPSQTVAPTEPPTATPSQTVAPTKVPTATPSQTVAPTEPPTATPSQTVAPTEPPTATPSQTVAPTEAPTATPSQTIAPTATPSQTVAPTEAPTATPSQTVAPTEAPTATPSQTIAPTATPSQTVAPTEIPPVTSSPTVAPTEVPAVTSSPSVTPVVTPSFTPGTPPAITASPAPTPAPNPSPAPTPTRIPWIPPLYNPTPSPKPTATPVPTSTAKPSNAPVPTNTAAPSNTPAATVKPTATAAPSATVTPIPTAAVTPSGTPDVTPTPAATETPSSAPADNIPPEDDDSPANTSETKKIIIAKYPPADEQKLPSGQKGSPSTGEKDNTLPFVVVTIISGLGILFFGLKIASLKKNK